MIRRVAAIVFLFIVFIVLGLVFKPDATQSAKTRSDDSGLYRIKGVILVSVRQSDSEVDYFSWNNAKGSGRLSHNEKRRLREYGLKKSRKAYQHNGRAIYSLRFDNTRDESRIIQYVKSLPSIEFVQFDYYPEFCTEPNDFFYQPDSEDSSKHWVPYDYNIIYGNSDDLRQCGTNVLSYIETYLHCCTSDRKLPRQVDISKVEFSASILSLKTLGGMPPSAS